MIEQEGLIFTIYGKSPTIKIIYLLMGFPKNKFTSSEIIENLGMSKTTFYKYFGDLVNLDMVIADPKVTRPKQYHINLESTLIQNIRKNIDFVSERIADKETIKSEIKPLKNKIMHRKYIQNKIAYMRRLERQMKIEIKKLEEPTEI